MFFIYSFAGPTARKISVFSLSHGWVEANFPLHDVYGSRMFALMFDMETTHLFYFGNRVGIFSCIANLCHPLSISVAATAMQATNFLYTITIAGVVPEQSWCGSNHAPSAIDQLHLADQSTDAMEGVF